MDQVVLDVLLVGRGVPWVRFEADSLVTDDGEARDGVTNERTVLDYVHWDDFAHSPERNWADVERRGWVARRIALTRKEGVKRFGAKFNSVPLTMASRTSETMDQRERSGGKESLYADMWEIWDVVSKRRIIVATDFEGILEEEADPYGLSGFFPCPRPAFATLTNEDLFPIPDYLQYKPLAEELDDISGRIRKLTKMLRTVGLYDASAEGLGRLLDESEDGKMIAITNFHSACG